MARITTVNIIGILIVLLFFVGATHARNRVWETKLSLWSDAAQKSPAKSRPRNNLGNCYMLLDMPFKAIQEYQKAISLDSRNIEAYYNLGLNFERVGILNQAIYYFDVFCKSAPLDYREQKQTSCESVRNLSGKLK